MNKSVFLILFLGSMVLFGCSQSSFDLPTASDSTAVPSIESQPNASQSGTVQISIPVDTSIMNDCTGELVDVAGTDHLIAHQTINGSNINQIFLKTFKM
jgi:hypothetical protein